MAVKVIPISNIRLDGDTQPRVAIDQDVVQEYAEAMKSGQEFPPVELYYDGANYWLVDGFHRFHAARKIGCAELNADVRTGMQTDAQWASLAANSKHGLRRSNADKAKAVNRALRLKSDLSDCAIAAHIGVSASMVVAYRKSMSARQAESTSHGVRSTVVTGRDGRTYNVAKLKAKTGKPRSAASVSGKTMQPVRQAVPIAPSKAMSMPFDPVYGAKALMALFDRVYVTRLVAELQNLLASSPETQA